MKNIIVLLLTSTLSLCCFTQNLSAQYRDAQWSDPSFWADKSTYEAVSTISNQIENYYNTNYFSKGISKSKMSQTGYYPYLRQKLFYEYRRNEEGQIPQAEHWNNILEFRKKHWSDVQKNGNPVANWENIGPSPLSTTIGTGYGGRMISLAFDPIDPNIIYAGAAEGGLWKSTNGGLMWHPMTDQLPAVGVSSVIINPKNPDVLLIGTGEGKSYFTFSIYSLKPGIGVFKSYDGGTTWQRTSFNQSQLEGVATYDMVWDTQDSSKVYLAASNGLWVSRNAGNTWQRKLTHRMTSIDLKPDEPNILVAAAEGVGLYRSTDGGDSWSLNNSLPTGNNFGNSVLSVCRDFPNFMLLSAADFNGHVLGLYKSSDGGETWTNLNRPDCYLCSQRGVPLGWYVNIATVSPTDTNKIVIGGTPLYISNDGGTNWTPRSIDFITQSNVPYVDQHGAVFSPFDSENIFIVNDGGITQTTDGGVTWRQRNRGIATGQFYSIAISPRDTNFVIGGFQDHGFQRSMDVSNNQIWTKWAGSDGVRVLIDHQNEDIIYGEYINGTKIRSTNRGTNIVSINNGISGGYTIIAPFIMHPEDSRTLYTATLNQIYKTTNGGSSWQAKSTINFCKHIAISSANPQQLYASAWPFNNTTTSEFWQSSDGGESWQQTTSAPGWRVLDIEADPRQENIVYAVRSGLTPGEPHVLKSSDYGATWLDITNNLPDVGVNALTINPFNNQHIYLATDFGVYATITGGEEWFEFNTHHLPLAYSFDLQFNPTDTTVVLGTMGRSAWRTKAIPFDFTPTAVNNYLEVKGFATLDIYPNPSREHFNFNWELEKARTGRFTIYNLLGQPLTVIAQKRWTKGKHQLTWTGRLNNGNKVRSGVYYLQVELDGIGKMYPVVVQ